MFDAVYGSLALMVTMPGIMHLVRHYESDHSHLAAWQVFDLMDKDRGGSLNLEEIKQLMDMLGMKVTRGCRGGQGARYTRDAAAASLRGSREGLEVCLLH
jgi:hypothetical protein